MILNQPRLEIKLANMNMVAIKFSSSINLTFETELNWKINLINETVWILCEYFDLLIGNL